MENLELYNSWREVPQNAQKTITGGNLNGKTDINPMWRIKVLTDRFGPVGFGWYTKITEHWTDTENIGGNVERVAWVRLELYIKQGGEWSEPIEGVGGSKYAGKGSGSELNDEAFKMAETDALSVACKKLGIGADIYWAGDNTKYTQGAAKTTKAEPATKTKTSTATAPKFRPITMTEKDAQLRQLLGQWVAEGYKREGCEQTMNNAYKVTIPDEVWNEALKVL